MTITDVNRYCDKYDKRIIIILDGKSRTTYNCAHESLYSCRTHCILFVLQPGVGGHYHYVTNPDVLLRGIDNNRRLHHCKHCLKIMGLR